MHTVRDLLRDADPLRHEPALSDHDRNRMRQATAVAAAEVTAAPSAWFRAPLAALAVVAAIVIGILSVGTRGPGGNTTLYAAVRLEVRLAEVQPGPGLREVRLTGSDRTIYLHDEVVVSNADIERASAVTGSSGSRYNIGVRFNAAGAEKMRRATIEHDGRPIAILIDGEVVMAPVIRSPIGADAVISGDYSRAEAERIINGIGVR
jgi:hypothetical protein